MALVKTRLLPRLALLLALALSPALGASRNGAEVSDMETRVKAAFVYKFATYVDWPEGTFPAQDAPLVFGVMGDAPMADELGLAIAGRNIAAHPLTVRKLSATDDLSGVNVLFVSDAAGLAAAIRATNSKPVLIVSAMEGGLAEGSAINFIIAEGRVRFEISAESAERRALKLSSRLLAVAHNLRPAE
jgi:YfiR/HmsC-like